MRITKTLLVLSLVLLPLAGAAGADVTSPVESLDVAPDAELTFLELGAEEMAGKACQSKPRKDCYCPMVYDPVCGCDGQTYSNSCVAQCEGIRSYSAGSCA